MIKELIVIGCSWMAEVNVETDDYEQFTDVVTEAATRAVEAKFKRRNDILIVGFESEDESPIHELDKQLINMVSQEIDEGTGIGALLCVIDKDGIDSRPEDNCGTNEWFVNTATVLNDAGLHWLLKKCVTETKKD